MLNNQATHYQIRNTVTRRYDSIVSRIASTIGPPNLKSTRRLDIGPVVLEQGVTDTLTHLGIFDPDYVGQGTR